MRKFLEIIFTIIFYGANIAFAGFFALAFIIPLTLEESKRGGDPFAPWPLAVFAGVVLTYVVNIFVQRRLKALDYSPGFRALLTISIWALRLGFAQLFMDSQDGKLRTDSSSMDALIMGPMIFGLLFLIWVLWYGKITREKVEGAFLLATTAFAVQRRGKVLEETPVSDILRSTDLIRQKIHTTKGDSYHVEIPLIIAWPQIIDHYFGVHILRTFTRTGQGVQMAADWTACWLGPASDAEFSISKNLTGHAVEGRDAAGDDRIKRVIEVMDRHGLTGFRVKDGNYLAVKKLRTRFVFFGIKAPGPAEIEAVANAFDFLRGAGSDFGSELFEVQTMNRRTT